VWLLTDPSLGCKEVKEIDLNQYRYYKYDLKIFWMLSLITVGIINFTGGRWG
jgi:hypothetical protein